MRQTSGLCFPAFDRYVGIDYSGAETPTASLPGLRVYMAVRTSPPADVQPPPSPRKHWTRRGIAEWLTELLNEDRPTVVGIDHGFSFPLQYFRQHNLVHDWPAFLEDFQRHWPTDGDHVYVDFVRDGACGDWAARSGSPRWRRRTEERIGAKSVFHFDVPGSVAKSTHAGLPWLRFLRERTAGRVHFWPFDGWSIPPGRSVVAEVYPSLWRGQFTPSVEAPPSTPSRFSTAGTDSATLGTGIFRHEADRPTDVGERTRQQPRHGAARGMDPDYEGVTFDAGRRWVSR